MVRWAVGVAILLAASNASAAHVDRVEATGLGTTRIETLTELLPRDAPADFDDDELHEFERRVRNLALFDHVAVSIVGGVLHVDVRRKHNIEPELDFATGRTVRDTEVAAGAVHHDVDGKGSAFAIGSGYAERFARFEVALSQHTYRARKWAYEAIGYYGGSAFRFESSPTDWVRGRLGGEFEVKPPYWFATPFHFHASINAYAEKSVFARGGEAPRGGVAVSPWLEAYWDRWTFNDLTPHGLVCGLRLAPGIFLGPNVARHLVRFDCIAGSPLRKAPCELPRSRIV